jgi:hypothetical protein
MAARFPFAASVVSALRRLLHWPARVGLGLFVLWQVYFLLAANLLDYAADESVRDCVKDAVTEWADAGDGDAAGASFRKRVKNIVVEWADPDGTPQERLKAWIDLPWRWGQATGQPQGWSLFVSASKRCTFPLVEMRWDEPPEPDDVAGRLAVLAAADPLGAAVLARAQPPAPAAVMAAAPDWFPSDNLPNDIEHFVRFGNFRLRRYESSVGIYLGTDGTAAFVAQEWDAIQAYLRWRLQAYLARHPDRPCPRQVILYRYQYDIPDPGGDGPFAWDGPEKIPVARWRPAAPGYFTYYPVEAYNAAAGEFEWVPR